MTRPEYTPEQAKAVTQGKLDQECQDCFGGSAVSTDRCWHCGSPNIVYKTHHEQVVEEPEATQFLCGGRRGTPERWEKVQAARHPDRQSV